MVVDRFIPLNSHIRDGMGSPTAVQLKVTFCPTYVMMFCGGDVITGTTRMRRWEGKRCRGESVCERGEGSRKIYYE